MEIETQTTAPAATETAPISIDASTKDADLAAMVAEEKADQKAEAATTKHAAKKPVKKATAKKATAKKAAPKAKAPKAPKAKRASGVKAQGQVHKDAFKLLKAMAKEKDVKPAEIVRLAVHKFVGFKEA